MQVNDEDFWRALQRSRTQAEAAEQEALAAAERWLLEVGDDAEPLPDAQIDAMVERALAPEARPHERAPGAERPAVPAERSPVRRVVLAAAAVLFAPKFLAAATVATVVAATAFVLQRTTETLSFQRAVHILVDEHQSEANRDAAQGTVFIDLVDAIRVVRRAGEEHTELAVLAGGVLQRLRGLLVDDDAFVRRHLVGSPTELCREVRNAQIAAATRRRALTDLGELMAYGVSALKQVERGAESGGLRSDNRIILQQLAEQLR